MNGKEEDEHLRAKEYAKAKESQLEYYDSMEIIDRAYFHTPAKKGSNAVTMSAIRHLPPHLTDEIERARKKKNDLLKGLPWLILSRAVNEALMEHELKLKPCTCNTCMAHRGE